MSWSKNKIVAIILRILSSFVLFGSLFIFPLAIVFALAVFWGSIFSWYIELFIFGFFVSALASIAMWKLIIILGTVLLTQEFLKSQLEATRLISRTLVVLAGIIVLITSTFLFL